MMSGYPLLALSLTAGLFILVAIVTPGWVGLDIVNRETEIHLSMNIFYSKVCVKTSTDQSGKEICQTLSNAEAVNNHLSSRTSLRDTAFRFTELLVEASLSLIGIAIGTVLTVIFAVFVIQRNRPNSQNSTYSSNGLSASALTFIIVGGVCGGIVCIEFIAANSKINDAVNYLDNSYEEETFSMSMKKSFPYSILLMFFGLFLEFIAICVHIACMRSKVPSGTEIILSPAVNAPTVVVHNSTTTSSVPYSKFT